MPKSANLIIAAIPDFISDLAKVLGCVRILVRIESVRVVVPLWNSRLFSRLTADSGRRSEVGIPALARNRLRNVRPPPR